jgi:hypothetical protein
MKYSEEELQDILKKLRKNDRIKAGGVGGQVCAAPYIDEKAEELWPDGPKKNTPEHTEYLRTYKTLDRSPTILPCCL